MNKIFIIFLVSLVCHLACQAEKSADTNYNGKQEIVKTGSIVSGLLSLIAINISNQDSERTSFFDLTNPFPFWKQKIKMVNLKNEKVPP